MADWARASTMGAPHLPFPRVVWVRYLVRPSFRARRAVLRGITPGCAVLLAEEELEPGTLLLLELPASSMEYMRSRLARVCSAESRECGGYLLRCRFTGPPSDQDHPVTPQRPDQAPAAGAASGAG
jgi:hypothetical protein